MTPGPWRVAVIIAVVATLALSAQQQAPVFRSGVSVVPVTVSVVDRKGNSVEGLQAKDFRIFEGDRPREIVAFYPQALEPGVATPPQVTVTSGERDRLVPATRRYFVIIVGLGDIDKPINAFQGTIDFVRNGLLPQDAVSVMLFHRATDFTTDHEAVATVLERYRKELPRLWTAVREASRKYRTGIPITFPPRQSLQYALGLPVLGRPPLPKELMEDIDRSLFGGVLPLTSLRDGGNLLTGIDQAAPTGERRWIRQPVFRNLMSELDRIGISLTDAFLESETLKFFSAIEALRHADGNRQITYIGGGHVARNGDLARMFGARANDARVVFNYIFTQGASLIGRPAASSRPSLPRAGTTGCLPCRDLVELTGGSYTTLDYAKVALDRIETRSRATYLIGYTPLNSALDGTYRKVRIELTRPGLTAHYRQGYFATAEPAPVELRDLATASGQGALSVSGDDATDLRVTVGARVPAAITYPAQLPVDISLDISNVDLDLKDGLYIGQLEVVVYCGDAREKVVGESRVRWNVRADAATHAEWLKAGLKRTIQVPVTAAPTFVKVVVYDPGSDRAGSATTRIK
jgi:VWFA-related protein